MAEVADMNRLKTVLHPVRAVKEHRFRPFRQWAVAWIVCNFNVDVGPEVELVYPPDPEFSASDLSAICFNSFPERHESETSEDLSFDFSLANNSPDIKLESPCPPHGSPTTLYGNVVFRQEYDSTSKRSFNQKSIVLISSHPFTSLFLKLLRQMTFHGHISDPSTLETACAQMGKWPPPSVGRHQLPFLGTVLTLEIAPNESFALQGLPEVPSLSELSHMPIYAYEPVGDWHNLIEFWPSYSEFYGVYERLLLGESVIVLAHSPQVCSQCVSALVDLIRPIPYSGVVRPYLTMQSDFRSVGLDGGAPEQFLVGITNPFLLTRLTGTAEKLGRPRPHVVTLEKTEKPVSARKPSKRGSLRGGSGSSTGDGVPNPAKRFFKSDQAFLRELDTNRKEDGSPTGAVGSIVRRHFAEITAQFLAPLNRYLATSISTEAHTPGGAPAYPNFSTEHFLENLTKHGSSVKVKGQNSIQRHKALDRLYESFVRSPNFYSWLDSKLGLEREANAGLLGPPPVSEKS